MDFRNSHLHIVGLGLMGGSLAMALRGKAAQISGEDVNKDVLGRALADGVINSAGRSADADIVVLAIPPGAIVEQIPTLQAKSGALVIDVGSTKVQICEALDNLPKGMRAVGGHPMCGLAENGYRNATGTLYQGARFVLCETARTDEPSRALAEALATAAGAHPLWMERQQHDTLTGLTSHLPHLLNVALMRLAMDAAGEDERLFELAAGGFDGATRLARTDAAMIAGMLATNPDNVRALLERLRDHVDALEALLDNPGKLQAELDTIVEARRQYTDEYGERLIT